MQVELLVHTYYGKPLKPGDVVEVDASVAERWEKNRIARIVGGGTFQGGEPEIKLTVAELKEIAEANGVDISGLTKKADIIAAIQAAGLPL